MMKITITNSDIEVYETSKILDKKLNNNDINVVSIILGFLTEKCECCNEINFEEEIEEITVPKKLWNEDCIEHHHKMEIPDMNICKTCADENTCDDCGDYCCDDCDNKYLCEDCDKIFCEDCEDENLYWCGMCQEKSCCRKVYKIKTYDSDGNDVNIYRCENCLERIN